MISDSIKAFRKTYNALEDELSKEIYLNRMNYLLTGDKSYVQRYVTLGHPSIPCRNYMEEREFLGLFSAGERVVFYGMGRFSDYLLPHLKKADIEAVFTDSGAVIGSYSGFPVVPYEKFLLMNDTAIVISTTKYYNEVKKMLLDIGIDGNRIIDIRGYFTCGSGDEYFYEDFIDYEKKKYL